LIRSASLLRQAGEPIHFLIMGYPDLDRYRLMAEREHASGSITFTGKIEYRNAAKYLALGDIAVASKVSATEGSGKLLNYMAMAQPVVAFDTPVHREYLADLGVYVPVGDVSALANAIRKLAHEPDRRSSLGDKLRLRAETQYNWEHAGREIEALYYHLTA
jgi:glycosyltransferase involved in cell wall biosynthesis